MTNNIYSYSSITDITEKALNKYVAAAINNPENAKGLQLVFNEVFWLWFELTREESTPDRDADGTRFMDLLPKFPNFGDSSE